MLSVIMRCTASNVTGAEAWFWVGDDGLFCGVEKGFASATWAHLVAISSRVSIFLFEAICSSRVGRSCASVASTCMLWGDPFSRWTEPLSDFRLLRLEFGLFDSTDNRFGLDTKFSFRFLNLTAFTALMNWSFLAFFLEVWDCPSFERLCLCLLLGLGYLVKLLNLPLTYLLTGLIPHSAECSLLEALLDNVLFAWNQTCPTAPKETVSFHPALLPASSSMKPVRTLEE